MRTLRIAGADLNNLASNNEAGRTLLRFLRLALPDEETCNHVLRKALYTAKKAELPCDASELLDFVRTHLALQLSGNIAPHLVFALLDDLSAEIEQLPSRDSTIGRLQASTRIPPALGKAAAGETPDAGSLPAEGGSVGDDTLLPSLQHIRPNPPRATAYSLSDPWRDSDAPMQSNARISSVVLVGSDRLTCARLARSLVAAHFDVKVLETSQIDPSVTIAIVDVTEDGIDGSLRALVTAHPDICVVARTEVPLSIAERILNDAGVHRFQVVSKAASALEILRGLHQTFRRQSLMQL